MADDTLRQRVVDALYGPGQSREESLAELVDALIAVTHAATHKGIPARVWDEQNRTWREPREDEFTSQSLLEAAGKVSLAPLTWNGPEEETFWAETILGRYAAWVKDGQGYWLSPTAITRLPVDGGLAGAQTAALAHYRSQIFSVIQLSS